MQASKCDSITKGTPCSWNTVINGKVIRLTGMVTSVPSDIMNSPFDVKGIDLFKAPYTDKVYLSDNTFEVYPLSKTSEENKLVHELGALLYALGKDLIEKEIELKLDKSLSGLYFSNLKELMNLCTLLYSYEVEPWKVARLCINIYNLLSNKGYLIMLK